jgi:oxygen-independent coproporphyrinogen-3 oxidase
MAAGPPGGLYLHIPFCAAICHYCNFNRGLFDEALKGRYVDALIHEIETAPEAGAIVDTVFFGGGTPSLLTPAEVERLLAACRGTFAVADGTEVTLEANPESATAVALTGYREAGVTRLSLGVQSFRDEELARLGRLHSAETARRAVGLARSAGFDNISLDLMLWLPGQSRAHWRESVDRLVDLRPDHASVYLLEIYPNAPLRDEMARAGWSVAPDDDAADMYLEGMEQLEAAGLVQYEISNVARPGRAARHNLKYWQGGNWVGFGCGAHSTWNGVRWRNLSATSEYVVRVLAGEPVRIDRRRLTAEERLEEALFMGLRLVSGLDLPAVRADYGVDVWERFGADLSRWVEAGCLSHVDGQRLALTRQGMLVANEIMTVFIGGTVR